MKEELKKQAAFNSEAQSTILDLKEKEEEQRLVTEKKIRSSLMLMLFKKMKLSKMHVFFRVWSTNNTLISVAQQFRSQVESLLKQNTDDMNKVV